MEQKIIDLIRQGVPYGEIVTRVGCARSTISYYATKNGLNKDIVHYDWKEIQEFYDQCQSKSDCIEKFGFSLATWTKAVSRGDLKISDWRIPMEELLVADRPITNRTHLKGRLFKAGLLDNKCAVCSCPPTWREEPLVLVLDHINGKNTDNRLENLRLLCPNCNSQQSTFLGRNKKNLK